MNEEVFKPELLAPAGSLEKLKFAIDYGADAVYLGGKTYGLRAFASNFDQDEMQKGLEYAHSRGKRVYVTVNIIPHNEDLCGLEEYLKKLYHIGVDAVIVSDPGIISIAKEIVPGLELHLSTQANCTNWRSALFWKEKGIQRIIMARELSLSEIQEIRDKSKVPVEAFVHGAMCISYSGRCLLSAFMAGRHANRGACAHPCRWKYQLVEKMRPGEYYPIEEDERGTYILNSKDLCMLKYLPQMIKTGISAFKIEGRMKSVHYVATVTRAYRMAIDSYFEDPYNYILDEQLMREVEKAATRPFTTGFYFTSASEEDQIYSDEYKKDLPGHEFVAVVLKMENIEGVTYLLLEQRNRFEVGDVVEFIGPYDYLGSLEVKEIINSQGEKVSSAPHPQEQVMIPVQFDVRENSLVRKVID